MKALLEYAGIRPSKRLGQNFLVDLNLMRIIVKEAELSSDDVVLEVGCATGRLTELLAQEAGSVYGVEIDPQLADIARKRLADHGNVSINSCDILESKRELNRKVVEELKSILSGRERARFKVVSNLAYSISSPVIGSLLLSELPVELMVVTLQQETAQRITAKAGSKEYGTLSVLAQVLSDVKTVRSIPPTAFWPRPVVSSTIVKFIIKPRAMEEIKDVEKLLSVLRAIFGFRRKKLRNVVGYLAGKAKKEAGLKLLEDAGIDPDIRGESLGPDEMVGLANLLANKA